MKKGYLIELYADGEIIDIKLPCEPLELNMLDNYNYVELYRTDTVINLDDEPDLLEALHRLNAIAHKEAGLTDDEYSKLNAVCAFEHAFTIDDVEKCLGNLESYEYYPDMNSYEDYLEEYLKNNAENLPEIPERCTGQVGRMILTAHGGSLTEYGIIFRSKDRMNKNLSERDLKDVTDFISKVNEYGDIFLCYDPDESERKLFFANPTEEINNAWVGYLRISFGRGAEFQHRWFRMHDQLDTPKFRKELQVIIDSLRTDWLKDRSTMTELAEKIPLMDLGDMGIGFKMQTQKTVFFVRCSPKSIGYDCCCHCYDRSLLEQEMNEEMSEEPELQMGGMS